jgi:hypothetical protein
MLRLSVLSVDPVASPSCGEGHRSGAGVPSVTSSSSPITSRGESGCGGTQHWKVEAID